MVHVTFAGGAHPRSPYTVTVWAKVGQPQLPSTGHISSRVVLDGGSRARAAAALPWLLGRLCFHCWGLSSSSSRLLLSLSLSTLTFGKNRSSCLETCCSLLCPQGQRYLDLSSSGSGSAGGLGVGAAGGELVWMERRRRPATSGPVGPQVLGSWSLPVLSYMAFLHPGAAHQPSLVGDRRITLH